ncbi:MAG: class I SAM-dependent methyltransferase [Candidatus Binatia bacterium]
MFSKAEAYDRRTGRYSRLLAGPFIDFVGINDGERLLDVGCGTGSLTFTAAALTRRSEIVGIDPSSAFIEYARSAAKDSRLIFEIGDALSLPYPDSSFDKCLCLLVIQLIPDVRRALAEMRRVTKPGGAVAAAVWERDNNELHSLFWDSVAVIDPAAKTVRDERLYVKDQLSAVWTEGGFSNVEEKRLEISPEFKSFDDFWAPFFGGQGSGGSYFVALPPDKQQALRAHVRDRLLGEGPDGPFTLKGSARAVRGVKETRMKAEG